MTAGNSCALCDAAAAAVVMTAEKAEELGVKPMAKIVAYANAGVDPAIMGIGPVPAVHKALDKAGLKLARQKGAWYLYDPAAHQLLLKNPAPVKLIRGLNTRL